MVPVALSDVIAVGEVPTLADVEILAKAGFRSLLNTQPDGEVGRLLTAADTKVAAERAGLAYRHLPIASRRPDEAALAAFAQALNDMPRPIYACCYSGARTAAAWALAAAPHHTPDQIIDACAKAGYDIEFMRPTLIERNAVAKQPSKVPTTASDFVAKASSDPVTAPPVPMLKPNVLIPRAASVGGFAVAG